LPNEKWKPPKEPNLAGYLDRFVKAWEEDQPTKIAFDTETTGLEFFDTPFCVTVSWFKETGEQESHYVELEREDGSQAVRDLFKQARVVIGHNLKFDLQKLILVGLVDEGYPRRVGCHDTEALAHLDDEHRGKRLKDLAVELLDIEEETIEVEVQSGKNKGTLRRLPKEKYEIEKARLWAKKEYGLNSVKEVGYHLLPRGVVVPYAISDARYTLSLYEHLLPRITRFSDLTDLYRQEMQVTRFLLDMERQGMGVDIPYVDAKVIEFRKRCLRHEKEIEGIVGKPVRTGKIAPKERDLYFNPQSNDELRSYFGHRGIVRESYDADALAEIDDPLAKKIVELRKDAKLLGTYLEAIAKEQRDSVLHPSTRQHGTVSGRTSSGKEEGD
jgi:DNA polymerase I-like protein with 3'-5' exonuclease and polymerase domains